MGYNLVERWEHEGPRPWWNDKLPPKRNETYLHAIVFDFESYQDKTKASNPTRDLSYESEHVPILVSIADTINTEPEYICSRDPNEVIRLFYQSLVQRKIIPKKVEERYLPSYIDQLPNKQQNLIKQWCGQGPVIGFNSGRYDLNLIRKYFLSHLGQEKVDSGEKQGQIMNMKTPQFVFLDVINHLARGITYDKWVKTYGAKQTKSWLPYEWFDSADKLDYKGLPSYRCWFSQLKNSFALTPKEYDECKRFFKIVECRPSETGWSTTTIWMLLRFSKLQRNESILHQDRQTRVLYTKDEDEVDKYLRSAYFKDLEEIGDAYKIESRKNKVTINRPYQIGIVVYQLAKLRMLQFYYDFLDKYIDRRDYELIQMDTDSMYFALIIISYDTLEEAVKPELKLQFENNKKQWLSWDKWSNREPGLFKLKKEGTSAIALCSKCYFVDDKKSAKTKMASKDVSQKQDMPPPKPNLSLKFKQEHNELLWRRYERALEGYKDMATNRGFRMKDGAMYTYEQHKLGLSAYYDKRGVLEDGIHTEPIEFHTAI